jgi:hypothetical protein
VQPGPEPPFAADGAAGALASVKSGQGRRAESVGRAWPARPEALSGGSARRPRRWRSGGGVPFRKQLLAARIRDADQRSRYGGRTKRPPRQQAPSRRLPPHLHQLGNRQHETRNSRDERGEIVDRHGFLPLFFAAPRWRDERECSGPGRIGRQEQAAQPRLGPAPLKRSVSGAELHTRCLERTEASRLGCRAAPAITTRDVRDIGPRRTGRPADPPRNPSSYA